MKKFFFIASALFLASLASCQKAEVVEVQKDSITINVVADGTLVNDETSKTAAVVDGRITKIKWLSTDAITLYEYVDGYLNETKASSTTTLSNNDYTASFKVSLEEDDPEGNEYVYTACYPVGAFSSSSNYDRYQIPSTQTLANGGNFDPSADILFGKIATRSSRVTSADELGLQFKRLGTLVKLTLKGITSGEVINTITITAPEKIAGYTKINFRTGEITDPAYDGVKTIVLNANGLTATGEDVIWFRCVEGTWAAESELSIVIDTDQAGYSRTISLPQDFVFAPGGFTKFSIGSLASNRQGKSSATYTKVTTNQDDWSGEYLLVYENTTTEAYVWTGVDASSCFATAAIENNTISVVPATASTLTVAKMEGGYSIKVIGGANNGKYIGRIEQKNGLSFSDTELVNTLSISDKASVISSSSCTLRYNSNNDQKRFRYYTSGQKAIQLYKKNDTRVWNLQGISITTPPTKTTYEAGEKFDPTGMVVMGSYVNAEDASDTKTEEIAISECSFNPTLDASLAKTNTQVIITYNGKTATQNITVTDPIIWVLDGIEITTAPTKVVYTEGNTLDLSGMVVTAAYYNEANQNDEREVDVTDQCTFNPADGATLSTTNTKITATFEGKTAETTITVNPKPTEPVLLFSEGFGTNTGSARVWNDSYKQQGGVETVYSSAAYTITNAKQSKYTVGSTDSGLIQTSTATDAVFEVGPLNVSDCSDLTLSYKWRASSISGTYTTKIYYKTSESGTYTLVPNSVKGATSFVDVSVNLPEAAQSSTLYLKIGFCTSNTQALIDEVKLNGKK